MNIAEDQINQIRNQVAARGGRLLGMMVSLHIPEHIKINRAQLAYAISNHDGLDSSWAPDAKHPISLYLDVVRRLGIGAVGGYENYIDFTKHGFYVEEHKGYIGKKIEHGGVNAKIATKHKFFHCVRHKSQSAIDKELQSFAVDFLLEDIFGEGVFDSMPQTAPTKTDGDYEMDSQGVEIHFSRDPSSKLGWRISMEGGDNSNRYLPLLARIQDEFEEAMNEVYSGQQVRELMRKIIREKVNGQPVNGWYFTYKDHLNSLMALHACLKQLEPGIIMPILPVEVYPDQKNMVSDLAQGLTESMVKDLQDFQQELVALKAKGESVRQSTWQSKLELFNEFKNKVDDLRYMELLALDVISLQLSEIEQIFIS